MKLPFEIDLKNKVAVITGAVVSKTTLSLTCQLT